jgi:hypothetical protein
LTILSKYEISASERAPSTTLNVLSMHLVYFTLGS